MCVAGLLRCCAGKKIKDWDDFKQQLLDQFGSVKECSPPVVMVTHTEKEMDVSMLPETMLEKDIFPETDQEEKLVQEKDESTLINDAVCETELVGNLIPPLVEEVDMKAYEDTEVMVPQDSLEQQTGWFLRHEFVKQNYSSAPVLEEIDSAQFWSETVSVNAVNVKIACDSQLCGHSFQRVPSKRQRKCFKT